jgi:hypothetical protein
LPGFLKSLSDAEWHAALFLHKKLQIVTSSGYNTIQWPVCCLCPFYIWIQSHYLPVTYAAVLANMTKYFSHI